MCEHFQYKKKKTVSLLFSPCKRILKPSDSERGGAGGVMMKMMMVQSC